MADAAQVVAKGERSIQQAYLGNFLNKLDGSTAKFLFHELWDWYDSFVKANTKGYDSSEAKDKLGRLARLCAFYNKHPYIAQLYMLKQAKPETWKEYYPNFENFDKYDPLQNKKLYDMWMNDHPQVAKDWEAKMAGMAKKFELITDLRSKYGEDRYQEVLQKVAPEYVKDDPSSVKIITNPAQTAELQGTIDRRMAIWKHLEATKMYRAPGSDFSYSSTLQLYADQLGGLLDDSQSPAGIRNLLSTDTAALMKQANQAILQHEMNMSGKLEKMNYGKFQIEVDDKGQMKYDMFGKPKGTYLPSRIEEQLVHAIKDEYGDKLELTEPETMDLVMSNRSLWRDAYKEAITDISGSVSDMPNAFEYGLDSQDPEMRKQVESEVRNFLMKRVIKPREKFIKKPDVPGPYASKAMGINEVEKSAPSFKGINFVNIDQTNPAYKQMDKEMLGKDEGKTIIKEEMVAQAQSTAMSQQLGVSDSNTDAVEAKEARVAQNTKAYEDNPWEALQTFKATGTPPDELPQSLSKGEIGEQDIIRLLGEKGLTIGLSGQTYYSDGVQTVPIADPALAKQAIAKSLEDLKQMGIKMPAQQNVESVFGKYQQAMAANPGNMQLYTQVNPHIIEYMKRQWQNAASDEDRNKVKKQIKDLVGQSAFIGNQKEAATDQFMSLIEGPKPAEGQEGVQQPANMEIDDAMLGVLHKMSEKGISLRTPSEEAIKELGLVDEEGKAVNPDELAALDRIKQRAIDNEGLAQAFDTALTNAQQSDPELRFQTIKSTLAEAMPKPQPAAPAQQAPQQPAQPTQPQAPAAPQQQPQPQQKPPQPPSDNLAPGESWEEA